MPAGERDRTQGMPVYRSGAGAAHRDAHVHVHGLPSGARDHDAGMPLHGLPAGPDDQLQDREQDVLSDSHRERLP